MININLIAERRARKIRELTIIRGSILAVIGITAIMVLLNIISGVMQLTVQADLRRVNKDLADIQPQYAQLLEIRRQIAERQPVVDLLQRVRMSESAWMTIYADLTRIIPDTVILDSIKPSIGQNGISLRLTGRALDEETVGKFMLSFRQETRWANTAVLQSVSSDIRKGDESLGEKSVRFELTIPVRGMVGGDF